MNEKEREKRLNELAAKEEKTEDFSEIWAEIAPVIEQSKPKKKKSFKWVYMVASFAACLIIFCSVGIPLLLKNQEEIIYYDYDSLNRQSVEQTVFYDKVEESKITVVDLKRFVGEDYSILITEDGFVKGGATKFTSVVGVNGFMVSMRFLDDDVELKEDIAYDQTCEAKGTTIKYALKSSQNGLYTYNTFATYNSVNYTMEILTDTQDLTIFFNDFFA